MDTNPITANIMNLFQGEPISTTAVRDFKQVDGTFANILSEAFDTTVTTDRTDKKNSLELLMGESDDLSGILLDMQKAELSLQLALQIRNKILDAYNEVMRMTV